MKKNYHIITIGCQMNKSDSERIAGYLDNLGYKIVENRNQADLLVVTTCGVRQSAEDRIYGIIPKFKKNNPKKKVILTGCLSGSREVKERLKKHVDIWLPITELAGLSEKLGAGKKESGSLAGYLNIQPKYNSNFSAFIPIGNGCDNFCSYCYVPYARGREEYRSTEEIIKEVKTLVKNGYKEITLIAQNVNSYISIERENKEAGKQIDFPQLLKMVDNIEGDFWLRFATNHPKDMSGDLIETAAGCSHVCRHIHLPAQSGDDEILRSMNRKYTSKHYLNLIKKIRESFNSAQNSNKHIWRPPLSITTDIIVGFPGETEEQFHNTVKLFKEAKFDMAYISQYSPRPETVAAKLEDNVSPREKRRREEELTNVLRETALENNKKYLGKTVAVLVEGKNKRGEWYGKTGTVKSVRIGGYGQKTELTGKVVLLEITAVRGFGLAGDLR